MTYRIDSQNLTVIYVDKHGEPFDLNAGGTACETPRDLEDFVRELHEQCVLDADVRDDLIAQINVTFDMGPP
jgi:hypothetical protein